MYYLNQVDSLIQLQLRRLVPKLFSLVVICYSFTTVCGINYNALFISSRISLDKTMFAWDITFLILHLIRKMGIFPVPQYFQEVIW